MGKINKKPFFSFFLYLALSAGALVHCGGEDKPYDLNAVEEEEKTNCDFNIFLTADCVNAEKTPVPGDGNAGGETKSLEHEEMDFSEQE